MPTAIRPPAPPRGRRRRPPRPPGRPPPPPQLPPPRPAHRHPKISSSIAPVENEAPAKAKGRTKARAGAEDFLIFFRCAQIASQSSGLGLDARVRLTQL